MSNTTIIHQESTLSFTQGLLIGQLSIVLLLGAFIKFFIFGEPPSADVTAAIRATERRSRTLAHKRSLLSLRPPSAHRSSSHEERVRGARRVSTVVRPSVGAGGLTIESILSKTYYNVNSHQPESLDWFNVLIAQTLAQFRADAQRDDALLSSLTTALNGASRPPWLDEIRVVELSLGEEFPIFSNCRVIPVGEDGNAIKLGDRSRGIGWGGRLQARMDVDLSDFITLGLETKLLLNYPKPLTAILPVAVAVSVVRFSGTLSISFNPSSVSPSGSPTSASGGEAAESSGEGKEKLRKSATTLTFSFLDDYRLDFSIRSLVGSRARLQDVPKIAALVEKRLHDWFDERCVEPRVQEVVLPSLWPRKKNTRRGDGEGAAAASGTSSAATGTPLVGSLSRKEANEARKVVQMEARREVEREEEAKREWERQRERERQHEQEGEMRRRRVRGEHSHSTGSGSRREDEFAMPGSMPGGL